MLRRGVPEKKKEKTPFKLCYFYVAVSIDSVDGFEGENC